MKKISVVFSVFLSVNGDLNHHTFDLIDVKLILSLKLLYVVHFHVKLNEKFDFSCLD